MAAACPYRPSGNSEPTRRSSRFSRPLFAGPATGKEFAMLTFLLKASPSSPSRAGTSTRTELVFWSVEPCEPRVLFSGPADVPELDDPPPRGGAHVFAPHATVQGQTL